MIDPWQRGLITGADMAVTANPDVVCKLTEISGYLKVWVPAPIEFRSTYLPLK